MHIQESVDSILNEIRKVNQSFTTIAQIHTFVEEYVSIHIKDLYNFLEDCEEWKEFKLAYANHMQLWKEGIDVDTVLDYFKSNEGVWYKIKIFEIEQTENRKALVHYQGWPSKFDEWINLSDVTISPSGIHVKDRTKSKIKEQHPTIDVQEEEIVLTKIDKKDILPVLTSSSGRVMRRSTSVFARLSEDKSSSVDGKNADIDGDNMAIIATVECDARNSGGSNKNKRSNDKRKRGSTNNGQVNSNTTVAGEEGGGDVKDKNEWFCAICWHLEAPDGSDLMLCDGPCLRSYHIGCLKYSKTKMDSVKTSDSWFCEDCTTESHSCFICDVKGKDVIDVCKCNVKDCGKYFHYDCLTESSCPFVIPKITPVQKEYIPRLQESSSSLSSSVSISSPKKKLKSADVSTVKVDVVLDEAPQKRVRTPSLKAQLAAESPQVKNAFSSCNAPSSDASNSSAKIVTMNSNADETPVPEDANINNKRETRGRKSLAHKQLQSQEQVEVKTVQKKSSTAPNSTRIVKTYSFKCPYHFCDTCYLFYETSSREKGGLSRDLHRCLRCPRSFHINCIPPGSRYNSMCLLCPHHPDDILPAKDDNSHTISNGMLGLFWNQLNLPETYPQIDDPMDFHFKLPLQYQDDVSKQSSDYKLITRLEYDFLPEKERTLALHQTGDICKCVNICDERCLNRILNIECCDGGQERHDGESGAAIISHSHQVFGNCKVGGNCGNRQLLNKTYSSTEKIREEGMGWGLKAAEDIANGSLVIEYLGEIIDEKEMNLRMSNQRRYTPTDHDFYIMELDQGYFVDGKFKGNSSRFINHSCDPNCELQRWVVKGRMRIGIFAIRDIEVNEALSYDYQFDTNEKDAFKCYCGSSNCRGTMAPKKKKDIMANLPLDEAGQINLKMLSRHETAALISLGRAAVARSLEELTCPELELQRSYVSKYLPGDNISEIRSGPHRPTMKSGKLAGLFLTRNIRKSSNFLVRRRLQWKRASSKLIT